MKHRSFKSKAQAMYLERVHPELAADMRARTKNYAKLPAHVPIKAKHHRRRKTQL